jgi:hypothetical protein
MFVTKECCLTFLANPLGELARRGIAGTSRPQPIVIVNIEARTVSPGWIDTDLTKRRRSGNRGLHQMVLARTPRRDGANRLLRGHRYFSHQARRTLSPLFPSMADFRWRGKQRTGSTAAQKKKPRTIPGLLNS